MKNLLSFTFEGKTVRTIERDGVTQWFAKDVCDVLGLRNVSQAVSTLDDDEKSKFTEHTFCITKSESVTNPSTYGTHLTVTESGLYALIFRSRKPEAVRFRKWVTSEVLPQIRRQGYFMAKEENALLEGRLNLLTSRNAKLRLQNLQLRGRVIDLDNPQLLKSEAVSIRQRIKILAVVRNRDGLVSELVSFRRVDNELRGRVEYPVASGHRWESLPRRRLGDVLLALDEMEKEDADLLRSREKHQLKLQIQQELKLSLN